MQVPMLNVRKPPGLRGESQVARMRIVVGQRRPFDAKIINRRGDPRPVVKPGRGFGRAIGGGLVNDVRRVPKSVQRPVVAPSDIQRSLVGTVNFKRFRGVGARSLPFRAIGNLGGMMGFHTGD